VIHRDLGRGHARQHRDERERDEGGEQLLHDRDLLRNRLFSRRPRADSLGGARALDTSPADSCAAISSLRPSQAERTRERSDILGNRGPRSEGPASGIGP
jgi:hypothetical protein